MHLRFCYRSGKHFLQLPAPKKASTDLCGIKWQHSKDKAVESLPSSLRGFGILYIVNSLLVRLIASCWTLKQLAELSLSFFGGAVISHIAVSIAK